MPVTLFPEGPFRIELRTIFLVFAVTKWPHCFSVFSKGFRPEIMQQEIAQNIS
jgi:hypothetical protein